MSHLARSHLRPSPVPFYLPLHNESDDEYNSSNTHTHNERRDTRHNIEQAHTGHRATNGSLPLASTLNSHCHQKYSHDKSQATCASTSKLAVCHAKVKVTRAQSIDQATFNLQFLPRKDRSYRLRQRPLPKLTSGQWPL